MPLNSNYRILYSLFILSLFDIGCAADNIIKITLLARKKSTEKEESNKNPPNYSQKRFNLLIKNGFLISIIILSFLPLAFYVDSDFSNQNVNREKLSTYSSAEYNAALWINQNVNLNNSFFITDPGSTYIFNSLSGIKSIKNNYLDSILSFYPSEPRTFTSLLFQDFQESIESQNVKYYLFPS